MLTLFLPIISEITPQINPPRRKPTNTTYKEVKSAIKCTITSESLTKIHLEIQFNF